MRHNIEQGCILTCEKISGYMTSDNEPQIVLVAHGEFSTGIDIRVSLNNEPAKSSTVFLCDQALWDTSDLQIAGKASLIRII